MPTEFGSFDRIENEAELEIASRVFNVSVARFHQLGELREPIPESMMAVDDGHTARVPISSQVQMAFGRAHDSLEAFHDLTVRGVNAAATLRPYAHYALLRMACEGAGLAQWLLRPSRKYGRVLRSLNLEFTHHEDAKEFSSILSGDRSNRASPELDRILQRLNELKDTVPQLRERQLGRIPSWSDILIDLSPPRGPRRGGHAPESPFVTWKIATAFLHGSSATVRALSDIQQRTEFGANRVASVEMRPSWRVLAASFAVCVQMLDDLSQRHEFLATHDYSQRALL
ncbi:hypothetical protein ITJ43_14940 [Microbacterium sp. VKM Ac-2870]|uniref:hypothetical protein n=1 Tax=Microbacterium sp. VKM Ac-2870 TaxID=2783825 RepID=UPI00188D2FC8|nr:hypothetical protein [Microbacterium sp. VKM Ac-2870]MBF4563427.1 hypothetical protein [Microbacterium sp. VKM Ac-2870]